jgi:hypothetical protein
MYQDPQNMRFGGGLAATYLDPLVLIAMLVAIGLTFLLPRRYIIIPLLLLFVIAPNGQQYYIAGVHLYVGRVLILFAWIRILFSKKPEDGIVAGGWNGIDKIFLAWAFFRALGTSLEFMAMGAVINQAAFLWDTLGGYFLFRYLVRDKEDIVRVLKTFAFMALLLGTTMTIEHTRLLNVFGYIGGRLDPFLRDGAVRSQGPFLGPIPAGTFGATLLCLFLWLKKIGGSTFWGLAGIAGSLTMVYTSASSTPLMAVPAGILAICFWPARKHMRVVRWVLVLVLLIVHLSMKAPVWMLINHIDLVGGNSSYHRAMLIDGFITHFTDWWLIGVTSTANWGWDMWDQANQFVIEGESGGLITFVCFILIISRSLGRLGVARRMVEGDRPQEWSFWLLGAAMFTYVVSFFGISFSDQSIYGWFAILAIIGAATAPVFAESSEAAEAEDEQPGVSSEVETLGSPVPYPVASQS